MTDCSYSDNSYSSSSLMDKEEIRVSCGKTMEGGITSTTFLFTVEGGSTTDSDSETPIGLGNMAVYRRRNSATVL